MTKSAQECERECLTIKNFICRSYSFDISSKTCALSHHARQSVPKQSYVSHPSTEYHEITSCFDGEFNSFFLFYVLMTLFKKKFKTFAKKFK